VGSEGAAWASDDSTGRGSGRAMGAEMVRARSRAAVEVACLNIMGGGLIRFGRLGAGCALWWMKCGVCFVVECGKRELGESMYSREMVFRSEEMPRR
jgi:hypothetical protein